MSSDAQDSAPSYIARICYNRLCWRRPSGAKGKSRSQKAFEGEFGYGHEEWLLDPAAIREVDGERWRYGHLEAIAKSRLGGRRLAGHSIDVGLFTIRDEAGPRRKVRSPVIRIRQLEVLTEERAEEAWSFMKTSGRIDEMIRQVQAAEANPLVLCSNRGSDIVNIRFRENDIVWHAHAQYERDDSRLHTLSSRYQIHENDGTWEEGAGPYPWTPGPVPTKAQF